MKVNILKSLFSEKNLELSTAFNIEESLNTKNFFLEREIEDLKRKWEVLNYVENGFDILRGESIGKNQKNIEYPKKISKLREILFSGI